MRSTLIIAAGAAALLTMTGQAQAQANRTFVSGHGDDSNACSLAAPCRSFAGAIAKTNAGGEITVLDSAGYGTLTINKSITITNPGGVEAGITTTAGQTAITILSDIPIVVTLRGLTLEGGGVGQNGISANSSLSGALNIIDCVIKDFTGVGIGIGSVGNVTIAHSFVLNNGTGIAITTSKASVGYTTLTGNNTGITLNNTSAMLFDIHDDNNSTGLVVGLGSNCLLKHSTVVFDGGTDLNSTNVVLDGGQIFFANNNVIGRISGPGSTDDDGTNYFH